MVSPSGPGQRRQGRVDPAGEDELGRGDLQGSSWLKQRPRPSFDHAVTSGGQLLLVKMTLDFLYQLGMKQVSGAVGDDGSEHRPAKEVQIPQENEDLMAN